MWALPTRCGRTGARSRIVSRHASIPSMVFSDFNQDANSPRVATPPAGPRRPSRARRRRRRSSRARRRASASRRRGARVGSSPRLGVDSPLASERAPRGRFGRPALSCVVPSDGLRGGGAGHALHPLARHGRWLGGRAGRPARRPRRLRLRRRRLAAVVGVVARRRLAPGLGVVVRGRSRRAASDAGAPEDVATKADRDV